MKNIIGYVFFSFHLAAYSGPRPSRQQRKRLQKLAAEVPFQGQIPHLHENQTKVDHRSVIKQSPC